MSSSRIFPQCCFAFVLAVAGADARADAVFDEFVKPLFAANCTKCHGTKRTKGEINLEEIRTRGDLLSRPRLIRDIIEVIDAADMPPESEPGLSEAERARLLLGLKSLLRESATGESGGDAPLRRLNRFQYNNAVRDLFDLKREVFRLPEKLLTRHDAAYLTSDRMPDRVDAECRSLRSEGGLRGVSAYPKDLRAAHGFDNQADQLTLSPLLLDAFLRLSVSIVESPDFHADSVGAWDDLFAAPAGGVEPDAEFSRRLARFLRRAFRRPVEPAVLERYTAYVRAKLAEGLSFTESMKRLASAVLSSPLFLYRYEAGAPGEDAFAFASDLSFLLWGSGPDDELLRLAESGELLQPSTVRESFERMLADPKIERFLDAFPAQWMQLENVLAATPDPRKNRLFSLDKSYPASLQMVVEPLLLFDAVFVENRPIVELIAPSFSYRSDFLKTWYGSDLAPPPLDLAAIEVENLARVERRRELEGKVAAIRAEIAALDQSFPGRIAAALGALDVEKGQAKWESTQRRILAERVTFSTWHRIGPFGAGSLEEAHRKAFIDEGRVDLERRYEGREWIETSAFVDGKVHSLPGANCATYLYRKIESPTDRPLRIAIGSDDSFKLWLNGQLAVDEYVSRGVAPNQNRLRLELRKGENTLLMKVSNGGGGYGFYFSGESTTLPFAVLAALKMRPEARTEAESAALAEHYHSVAPELEPLRARYAKDKTELEGRLARAQEQVKQAPKPEDLNQRRKRAQRRFDDEMRERLRSRTFERVPAEDPRFGGVITNAAMLSMTSGPKRTHPIARGAWLIEVVFNDPPPPPPNDVPPLNEEDERDELTIRERFAQHRENPDCAGCHSRLDPLGFALENYDLTGRWRDVYENGRDVDASGKILRRHEFDGAVQFKAALVKEERRFARAFTGHLLRFALARELAPADSIAVDEIVEKAAKNGYRLRSLLQEVVLSDRFRRAR